MFSRNLEGTFYRLLTMKSDAFHIVVWPKIRQRGILNSYARDVTFPISIHNEDILVLVLVLPWNIGNVRLPYKVGPWLEYVVVV